jgi:hypothetical protein
MNSCPEADKIRDFMSGKMSDGERLRFQSHLDDCPECRRELSVETAIDLELSRELAAPEIERSVLRVLRLDEPARPFGWASGNIKYFVLAILLVGFGLWILPLMTRLPGLHINSLWLSNGLHWLIRFGYGHPGLMIGIGGTIYAGSALYTLKRLKLLRNII